MMIFYLYTFNIHIYTAIQPFKFAKNTQNNNLKNLHTISVNKKTTLQKGNNKINVKILGNTQPIIRLDNTFANNSVIIDNEKIINQMKLETLRKDARQGIKRQNNSFMNILFPLDYSIYMYVIPGIFIFMIWCINICIGLWSIYDIGSYNNIIVSLLNLNNVYNKMFDNVLFVIQKIPLMFCILMCMMYFVSYLKVYLSISKSNLTLLLYFLLNILPIILELIIGYIYKESIVNNYDISINMYHMILIILELLILSIDAIILSYLNNPDINDYIKTIH